MDSTPRRPSLPSFSVETSQEEWLFADFLEEDNVDDVEAMEIIDVESHERVQNGPLSNELFELTSFDVVPKPPCVETGEIAAGNDSLLESSTVSENESFDSELSDQCEPTLFDIVPETSQVTQSLASEAATFLEKELFLKGIVDTVSSQFPELSFTTGYVTSDNNNPVLTITQRCQFIHLPFGATSRVTITIQYKRYSVHVLMRLWGEGEISSLEDVVDLCHMFGSRSKYKFCPGLDPIYYESEYHKPIRYHIKSVRLTHFPFSRVESFKCKLWFLPALNISAKEKEAGEVMCPACKRMVQYLKLQKKRTLAESPGKKIKRQLPSSRARLKYMSPASQQMRKRYAQYPRSSNIRKLARLEESEVVLDKEQNEEMCAMVEAVQAEELEKLFQEGEQHGVGSLMKKVWFTDKDRQKKEFFQDQERNEASKGHGNRWSMITIRMALAVYTRSPAAYKSLQSFGILKLPSKSTMQAYTGAFMHSPGASNASLVDQVARYVAFKQQCCEAGKQEPKADGVLIFDEVKVACQIMWNSRNNQLMGLAMDYKDLASLNDIYKILKEPEACQTSYILQFLWRDLTSCYDIVGPYFTCSSSVESKFVLACVFETIKLFQHHGLKTSLLVCDGGSANIATIKATHGSSGAYSIKEDQSDKYQIEPWMINPFNPPNKIFWLICPSHQLKNMVNALFSSKEGGTKHFNRDKGVEFGWKAITDLYKCELIRASNNQARMVPRLKEAHCLRDSWTKLNVLPAKIMQQEQVLGELYWYVNQVPPPHDSLEVAETLAYLEACNLIFEQGFLSHDRIRSLDSEILTNITKGYEYFAEWLSSLLKKDPKYPHTSSTQRSFLSWQTWDLLRIDVYGMKAFCEWFLETYPTYFVSPLRLSGSSVESLFSQYKFNAGGKLDSVNFTTARAAHLVQQCATSHHSGKSYRDENLSFTEIPLQKKIYNKTIS